MNEFNLTSMYDKGPDFGSIVAYKFEGNGLIIHGRTSMDNNLIVHAWSFSYSELLVWIAIIIIILWLIYLTIKINKRYEK
jgi:hypothetical protein